MIPRLETLTYAEAELLRQRDDIVVLLPIGATEAHGPHLPLATDTLISVALAERIGAALVVQGKLPLIFPSVSFSVTEFARPFAGTVSVSHETSVGLIADICISAISQGFPRVCLVNSHLEPAHRDALREACVRVKERTGLVVAFPDHVERRFARTLTDEFKRGACHAGSYETSLLLAAGAAVRSDIAAGLEPHEVDLAAKMREGKRNFLEAGADRAYFGNPASATVSEGEETYARLVEIALFVMAESWQD